MLGDKSGLVKAFLDILTHAVIENTKKAAWRNLLHPPCFGPFSEPSAAAIAEYVSVPDDETTCVVNVELLPPPCSI